jgi:hypothetical protein
MANNSMLNGIDYNIESLNERKSNIEQVIKQNDDQLVTYFDDYYNPSLTQNSRLSDNDVTCRQLERMADYLLYADNKEKQKENHGEDLHLMNDSDSNKNKKKEFLTNDLTYVSEEENVVHQHKLYKKVKVTEEDRTHFPELKSTGYLIKHLKRMIDTGFDTNGNKINKDNMRKIKWYLIDIRKDEVAMKEMLKGYIRFKRISPESTDNDFSGFSFDNVDHIRTLFDNYSELKQNSFDDTHGDLKIIIEVFEQIVDQIDFEEYVFDIFLMKIDGLKREDIVNNINMRHNIVLSESRISQITKHVIPDIIVEEYKKNYKDWVYTFVIKGIYKICNKCGDNKLQSEFGINKRNKDGLNSSCKACRNKSK